MITKFLTSLDWKHWALTHLTWLILAGSVLVGGHVWLSEHDSRIASDAALKASQATISQLQQQIASTDKAAAAKTQTIVKIVHDLGPSPTVGQVATAVPQLTDTPLNARTIPGDPVDISVAAIPFLDLLQQAATDHVANLACQSDLTAQKAIDVQKDTQIAILKKKPNFWRRVGNGAKLIGIGLGAGLVLAAHGL